MRFYGTEDDHLAHCCVGYSHYLNDEMVLVNDDCWDKNSSKEKH